MWLGILLQIIILVVKCTRLHGIFKFLNLIQQGKVKLPPSGSLIMNLLCMWGFDIKFVMSELSVCIGIPKGVINVVTSDRSNAAAVGNELCTSPHVAGLSFTGKWLYNK